MSDKPIAERLQVKKDRTLAVQGAPKAVDTAIGVPDRRASARLADVVLLFAADRKALDKALPPLLAQIGATTILWIAYPKLTSALARDLNRDALRAQAPAFGLDTISQIAIDDDWSALRFKRI